MSKSWAGGSTRAWRRVREAVLARDGYVCRLGLDGCTTQATEAHHVLGRGVTGDDPDYCVAACRSCNLTIGDPTKRTDPAPSKITKW